MRSRPFSMLMELMIARPGWVSSAARRAGSSSVSIISGASMPIERRLTTSVSCSGSSLRSVTATQTSSACAPYSTCSRATPSTPS